MPKEKDILVSTTSTLMGLEIKHYLRPISAHIVAGVDFFSDFAASFTDIFGGRSKGYQNQLTTIYNEAIEQLKDSASKIGANGIIGLSVDMDEISGKGKAMFMVTAIGTAVIINFKNEATPVSQIDRITDLDTVENLKRKKELIEDAKANTLEITDENLKFIKTNQISEVSDFLFNYYKKALEKDKFSDTSNKLFDIIESYIEALPDHVKSEVLYGRMLNENNYAIQKKLCKLITDQNLLDISYVNKILDAGDFNTKKLSTTILLSNKLLYEKSDIQSIEQLIDRIKELFPETGSYGKKKGFLSSKEKDVWCCSCGKSDNNEIGQVCNSCHKDIYGFTTEETSPPEVIEVLREKKELLTELLL